MRDYLILGLILGSVPICFVNPFFGVCMWSWIAYFNPHRFAWGPAYNFPVATAIALPTLAGMVFFGRMNRRIWTRETTLLLLLWAWFCVTLFHATQVPAFIDHVADGMLELTSVSKILLMTFVMVLLTNSRKKLNYLFLVVALSFGALAIKGGIFGFRTAGEFRVWGPSDSFISDNNDFALATNMALPMLFFLAREQKNKWLKLLLRFAFLCGIVVVILTYSRGGFLGLAVVLAAIAVKAKRKLVGAGALAVGLFLLLSLAPPKWMERIHDTFFAEKIDDSAKERLLSWQFALNLAKDYPITGGGFGTFTPPLFSHYSPEPMPGGSTAIGPHSIYFQVIGEQGYVGLVLFLALLGSCWVSLRQLRWKARALPDGEWLNTYSHMLEASLFAYAFSGAFLGRAYFDLYFQIIACTIIMKIMYNMQVAMATQAQEQEEEVVVGVEQPAIS